MIEYFICVMIDGEVIVFKVFGLCYRCDFCDRLIGV